MNTDMSCPIATAYLARLHVKDNKLNLRRYRILDSFQQELQMIWEAYLSATLS